ncbi:MAG: hypothetical protein JXB50_08740 [Spirochaetes bacterium]|nr:hypothetical protein [Spirochaetota bacterium]
MNGNFFSLLYIDPGSGSLIIQILIGFFVSSALMIKVFWKKIISIFTKKNKQDEDDESEE